MTPTRLAALILLLAIAVRPAQAADPKPYRIGVIIPLTGEVASLGTYVRKGIDLCLSDMPGSERKLIDVSYEDDQFDTKKTVTAYQKLSMTTDAFFVIGSPPGNALSPLVESRKKVLIAVGASDPAIALDKQYSFIHWVTPAVLGEALASELIKRDFQRIAFVTAETSGGLADTKGAIDALTARGAKQKIIFQENYPREGADFRSAVVALKEKNPDVVIAVLYPGQLSAFTRQAKQLSLNAELAGMETFEDESEVKAAQGALEGAWYVNASDATEDFRKRYQAKYSEQPGWASANGCDSIQLVAKAVATVGTDNEKVASYLRSVKDFQGAAGRYSSSGDNRFLLPAALKKVSGTTFVRIEHSGTNG